MDRKEVEFLSALVEKISPSGAEEEAVNLWRERTEKFCSRVSIDIHGNAIGVLNEGKSPKVMLAGHIDEIGFMVKYINKGGFIYFSPIGGVDYHLLPGQRVRIKTDRGVILGVIGKKPIHLLEDSERKKIGKIEEFWVDIGAKDEKEAKEKVKVGDVMVFDVGVKALNPHCIVGRGLDDKAGAFVVSEVLRLLYESDKEFAPSVYGVATVQEEIGLRGARTSAYGISPDIGIVIEVAFATDHPGMDKRKTGEIRVGAGPVIAKGPNINPNIFRKLVTVVEEEKIPYQVEAIPQATGTDANVIQLTKAGVPTGLVSVPLRYMHTPVEMLSIVDLENTIQLVTKFILSL
ncbi:MAG: hydrolase [Candidatus Omnitrophica bacterium 4484_70.2]|nr:MAG: hydrolase [Candidatus Omnitrophica bacterium 4484_70.2]